MSFYIYLALAFATIVVFWQVLNHDFVIYDDPYYITHNTNVTQGLTRDSIVWAFTTGYFSNWHPLTWLSHMTDCQLFGLNPRWHHLTSLLLHLANTLLLFAVLKRMTSTLWQSAFVAAAFALHPLHVESVAWISERKDVLSMFFWLLTMAAYLRYVKRPCTGRYLLTLLAFALGLMAKPMLVTMPFVLLLLDYWPLRRIQFASVEKSENKNLQWKILRRLIWEKIPFFALTIISCLITFVVQQAGGAVAKINQVSITARLFNIPASYMTYILKMLWPTRLAVIYTLSNERLSLWHTVAATLILVGITLHIVRRMRTHPYLLIGWLWFLGTLVPVIGLIQVGSQAFADRYTYIPMTGLFIIIAWATPNILEKWQNRKTVLTRSAIIVLVLLSITTLLQLRHWRNSYNLFSHALKVTENNHIAHSMLAHSLRIQGKIEQAIPHNYEAIRIYPDYLNAHYGLGLDLFEIGRTKDAIVHFNHAIRINPNYVKAYNSLAAAFIRLKQFDKAIQSSQKALQIAPNFADAHYNLATALYEKGRIDDAINSFNQTLRLDPTQFKAHNNLGVIFSELGQTDQAIHQWQMAVKINPDDDLSHYNLADTFAKKGNLTQALEHYNHTLRIRPDLAEARKARDATLQKLKNK